MSEEYDIERGAAEEMADAPLTETGEQTSERSAARPYVEEDEDVFGVDVGADDEENDFGR